MTASFSSSSVFLRCDQKLWIWRRSFVDAGIAIAIQEWPRGIFIFLTCFPVTPIIWTAIVADQYQHAAVVASSLLVFAWRVSVVVVIVWVFAHQTSSHCFSKMGWIRSAWIKDLQTKQNEFRQRKKEREEKLEGWVFQCNAHLLRKNNCMNLQNSFQ